MSNILEPMPAGEDATTTIPLHQVAILEMSARVLPVPRRPQLYQHGSALMPRMRVGKGNAGPNIYPAVALLANIANGRECDRE